jgi:hypothetical protein
MLAAVVAGVELLSRSRFGALLGRTPLWLLVAVQGFRLPLELVMHRAALEGTMPAQMTFGAGYNYDIVTGASALLLAWALHTGRASRALVLAWNVLGVVLLLVVVSIGFASTPIVAAFGQDRLNTWILHAPFVWLPTVLVASAMLGHVLVFRALRASSPAVAPA